MRDRGQASHPGRPRLRGVGVNGDRILWNRRPETCIDTGDIDEIVAHGVTVHIEQMDDRDWWIGITWPDGDNWMGHFHANSRGVMRFIQTEDRRDGWPTDEEHHP